MNELTNSMAGLLNAIEPSIAKLAEAFNVSVDVVRENGMEYILMYGRLAFLIEIRRIIIASIFIEALIASISAYLYADKCTWCRVGDWEQERTARKNRMREVSALAAVVAIPIILWIASSAFIYLASPEMYSIKAVFKLLK